MYRRLRAEFLNVLGLYWRLIRKPTLFFRGLWLVLVDWFVNIPKSFFQKPVAEAFEDRLNRSSSFALGVSEIITIPGTYAGLWLFSAFGANAYVASVVGGAVGNYIAGASSFATIYLIITRGGSRYSLFSALNDSFQVIKEAFPVALLLYFCDAPVISALIALGASEELAVTINLILGIVLFTGVAKDASLEGIEKRAGS